MFDKPIKQVFLDETTSLHVFVTRLFLTYTFFITMSICIKFAWSLISYCSYNADQSRRSFKDKSKIIDELFLRGADRITQFFPEGTYTAVYRAVKVCSNWFNHSEAFFSVDVTDELLRCFTQGVISSWTCSHIPKISSEFGSAVNQRISSGRSESSLMVTNVFSQLSQRSFV